MITDTTYLATGEHTRIRPFTRADVDEWCGWPRHEDPLYRDYNSPDMRPRERDFWYADRLARHDHAMFAIVNLQGNLIGRLFLRQMHKVEGSAVLGVDLRSDTLDRGYGTDALRTFNSYYFEVMDYDTLKLDVAAYNSRARHIYENLGWVETGQHWSTYPSVFAPEVFTDPLLESVRHFFRPGPGTVSVLHFDMELRRERWLEEMQRAS